MQRVKEKLENKGLRPNTVKQYISQLATAERLLEVSVDDVGFDWLLDDVVTDALTVEMEKYSNSTRLNFFCCLKQLTNIMFEHRASDEDVKGEYHRDL